MSAMTRTRCSSTPRAEIFGEADRLDGAHFRFERLFPAPAFEQSSRAVRDLDRVSGEHFDFDFKAPRVSDFHQRLSGLDHAFAFVNQLENAAGDR